MHLAHMEFIGYHVFAERYGDMTPEQALFVDMGVMKIYSDMLGGDEKSQKEMERMKRRSRHYRRR